MTRPGPETAHAHLDSETTTQDADQPATNRRERSPLRIEQLAADPISRSQALWGVVAAALGAAVLALAFWFVFNATSLPAFNTSMVTRALSTTGIVATIGLTGGLLWWWLRDGHQHPDSHAGENTPRPRWRVMLTYAMSYLSPAMLTMASIGLPLSATRLWLDGIQVDQGFRTQFLTRATEQMGYADMNYEGMPTFYPLGWFWFGGRLANLLNIPGWEVYQPWALISLAVAGSILVPIWQRLVSSLPVATIIALTTTAITLTAGADEPYSAVIAMGVPAVAVLCARAFHGSAVSTLGLTLFLGISATFYTLFTGAISLTVVTLTAVATAVFEKSFKPIWRLVAIGVGSLAIAALAWGPYILAAVRFPNELESTAQHYLPEEGTLIPVPFLSFSVVGILCFIGLVFLVLRVSNTDVRTMGWALIGVYLWILASMVTTLAGTTLLGFRLGILVVLILATAGILALAEIRLVGVEYLYPERFSERTNKLITATFVIAMGLGGVFYAQQIPESNEKALDHAYTDTDGYGERADKFSGDAARHYSKIRQYLENNGHPAPDSVVLTDEKLFMAYNSYYGFNAFTSHYANPLGEFSKRNEQIEQWAKESWDMTPQEFAEALESSPWKGPDVMIFRGDLEKPGDGYKTHLAEDIYPNQPNVRSRSVFFDPSVFDDEKLWNVEQIGPFVVAARTA